MKHAGYLLVEMIIALATLLTFGLIVSSIHASIVSRHLQAEKYSHALDLAQNAIVCLQNSQSVNSFEDDGYRVTIVSERINPAVPFLLHTVTVSFWVYHDEKKIILYGGAVASNA